MLSGKDGFDRRAFLGSAWNIGLAPGANLPLLAAAASSSERFDFDTPYNRFGTNSVKWDAQVRRYGKDSIVAGLGVSDMDFRTAPAITKALAARVRTRKSLHYFGAPILRRHGHSSGRRDI